jgi:hypothetical protein
MKIIINDERKIFAIQEEFNKQFPFLKIEFFRKPSGPKAVPSKRIVIHPSKSVGECRTIHEFGSLTVTPHMTVAELEQNLRDVFGLSTQIFRKSGKNWLETSSTDGWTLEKENKTGEEMEKPETQEIV